MKNIAMTLLALTLVVACGDSKRDTFNTYLRTYAESESRIQKFGCNLDEKSAEDIKLDCTNVPQRDHSSLESALSNYVSDATKVLEHDTVNEKKFLSADERLRVQRKIMLANAIRGSLAARKE